MPGLGRAFLLLLGALLAAPLPLALLGLVPLAFALHEQMVRQGYAFACLGHACLLVDHNSIDLWLS